MDESRQGLAEPPEKIRAMSRLINHEQAHPRANSARAIRQLVLAAVRGWPLTLEALRALDDGNRVDALTVIDAHINSAGKGVDIKSDELLRRYAQLEGAHDGIDEPEQRSDG